MLISIDRRLAYLAMPKTGTTALEQVLTPLCDIRYGGPPRVKHMSMKAFQRYMRPYLTKKLGIRNVETLCVVREPADWLGSWYRYRQRKKARTATDTRAMSFAAFVEAYLATPQPSFAKLGGNAKFTTGFKGKTVTHLFRYESMPAVEAFLSERFGQAITLPRVNVSPRGEDLVLPPALRARLESERAADFAVYADLAR